MGYVETAFLTKAVEPLAEPKSVPRRVHALWENEGRHALLTGTLLSIAGVTAWSLGLRIAPVGCAIFAAALFAGALGAKLHR